MQEGRNLVCFAQEYMYVENNNFSIYFDNTPNKGFNL